MRSAAGRARHALLCMVVLSTSGPRQEPAGSRRAGRQGGRVFPPTLQGPAAAAKPSKATSTHLLLPCLVPLLWAHVACSGLQGRQERSRGVATCSCSARWVLRTRDDAARRADRAQACRRGASLRPVQPPVRLPPSVPLPRTPTPQPPQTHTHTPDPTCCAAKRA